MKRFVLWVISLFSMSMLSAQQKDNYLSAAINVGAPVYTATGSLKGIQAGVSLQKEWKWGRHFAGTASAGYSYFSGTIQNNIGAEQKNFAFIPLLAGIRYYIVGKFYAAMAAGVSIKAHSNAATKFTLVPMAGIILPAGKRSIDLGIQFSTVPVGYSYPEQKLLQRGGYSFLGIRGAWIF